jgi:hypothetical protein
MTVSMTIARTWIQPWSVAREQRPELPRDLRRLRFAGYLVIAVQLLAMLWWSHRIAARFSLTDDFGQYGQAWWSIAHGVLDPHDTISDSPFWHDHSVLLMWPLALISHSYLNGFTPLAAQDLVIVLAEVIAFAWILRLLRDSELTLPLPRWVVGAISVVLLTCNPWIFWAVSFDVHFDATLPAPLLVLCLRALYYGKYRQLVLWSVLVLFCGDLAVTYLAGVGLTAVVVSLRPGQRKRLMAGVGLMASGVLAFVFISHIGGNAGSSSLLGAAAHNAGASAPKAAGHHHHARSSPSEVSDVARILLHPGPVLFAPFHSLRNVWALLSPAGVLGLVSPWGLPLAGLIAVENTAAGSYFSAVAFQYVPAWAPSVVGGVLAALWLSHRRWGRNLASGLLVISLVNTLGWAIVWTPRVENQWVRIDAGAARILSEARSVIPAGDEAIVSEGVVGGFAGRTDVHAFPGNQGNREPIDSKIIYFVIVPYQGIELASVNQSLGLLGALAGPLHAQLLLHGDDVWVFRWVPKSTEHGLVDLTATYDNTAIPVWATHTAVGRPDLTGPASDWVMTSASRKGGYLLYGAYFHKPLGHYDLRVRLSTSGTSNVEAWNATGQVLLGRRSVPETDGPITVDVPVDSERAYPIAVYKGPFPFDEDPIPPPSQQVVEIRIYVPPGSVGIVYSVQLIPVQG